MTKARELADFARILPGASSLLPASSFGATPDADFVTGAGTDSGPEIRAWLNHLSDTGRAGILDGRYRVVGQLNVPSNVTVKTLGLRKSGFVIEIPNTESALCLEGVNCSFGSMTVSRNMTALKVGEDLGHIGNVVRLGNYINGAQARMGGFRFDDLRLMSVTGSFASPVLQAFGRVDDVRFGHVTIESTAIGQTAIGFQAHWSGNITAIGQTVTQSYHPNNIHFASLDMTDANWGVVTSAAHDISIGTLRVNNSQRAIYILAGDEGAAFVGAMYPAAAINTGIKFGKVFINGTRTAGNPSVQLVGVGTSKFQEESAGVNLQVAIPMQVEIEQLTAVGSNRGGADDCISTTGLVGSLTVGSAHIRGYSRYSAHIVRSNAQITIDGLDAVAELRVQDSILNVNGKIVHGGLHGIYAHRNGAETTVNTSADVAVGDTVIHLVSPGFAERVLPGDILTSGGESYRVTGTHPVTGAARSITISPAKVAISSGAAVRHDRDPRVSSDRLHLEGMTDGVRGIDARLNLSGLRTQNVLRRGMRLTGGFASILNAVFSGSGQTTADFSFDVVADGAARATIGNSRFGEFQGAGGNFSVSAEGTSAVVATGCVFENYARSHRTIDSGIVEMTGCWDANNVPVVTASDSAHAIVGGSADAITLTRHRVKPVAGATITFRASASNTGATTINLNGTGEIACRTVRNTALPAGYVRTDADTVAIHDGTFWVLDRTPEYGTSADGEFFRSADGNLRCVSPLISVDLTTAIGGQYGTAAVVQWTMPAAATGISSMTAYVSGRNTENSWGIARPLNATTINWRAWRHSSLAAMEFHIACVGRWY